MILTISFRGRRGFCRRKCRCCRRFNVQAVRNPLSKHGTANHGGGQTTTTPKAMTHPMGADKICQPQPRRWGNKGMRDCQTGQ